MSSFLSFSFVMQCYGLAEHNHQVRFPVWIIWDSIHLFSATVALCVFTLVRDLSMPL